MTAQSPSGNSARGVVLAAGLAWVLVLLGLVFTSSNPVVVNRTQILSSSVIAVGHRDPSKPDELVISRVILGIVPEETVHVHGWPELCPPGEIVVPLMRMPTEGLTVTQGELPNPPHKIGSEAALAVVRPLVYPATPSVFDQINSLVAAPAAR